MRIEHMFKTSLAYFIASTYFFDPTWNHGLTLTLCWLPQSWLVDCDAKGQSLLRMRTGITVLTSLEQS